MTSFESCQQLALFTSGERNQKPTTAAIVSGRRYYMQFQHHRASERCLLRWESEGLLQLQGSPIFFFLFEFFDERNTRREKRIIIKSLSLSSVHAEICVRRVLPKLSTPDCRVGRYKHVKKQQNTTRSSEGFFDSFLHTANYYIFLSTKKVNIVSSANSTIENAVTKKCHKTIYTLTLTPLLTNCDDDVDIS